MFDLAAIRDTAVYREAFTEGVVEGVKKGKREGKREGTREGEKKGKLGAVAFLLELGASEEQIAAKLALDIDEVRLAAQPQSKKPSSRKPRSPRPPQPAE